MTDQEKQRNEHLTSYQQRLQEAHNQLANHKEVSQVRYEDLQEEVNKLKTDLEAASKAIEEKDGLLKKGSEEVQEMEATLVATSFPFVPMLTSSAHLQLDGHSLDLGPCRTPRNSLTRRIRPKWPPSRSLPDPM